MSCNIQHMHHKINSNTELGKVRIYDNKSSRNCQIKPQKQISHTLLIFVPHTLLIFMNVISSNIFTTLYKAGYMKQKLYHHSNRELHYCYLCCKTIWVSLEQSLALHIFSFVWYLNMNNATIAATVLVARCLNMPGTFKLLSLNFWRFFFFLLKKRILIFGFFFTVLQKPAWHWISCQTIGWPGTWTNYVAASINKTVLLHQSFKGSLFFYRSTNIS